MKYSWFGGGTMAGSRRNVYGRGTQDVVLWRGE